MNSTTLLDSLVTGALQRQRVEIQLTRALIGRRTEIGIGLLAHEHLLAAVLAYSRDESRWHDVERAVEEAQAHPPKVAVAQLSMTDDQRIKHCWIAIKTPGQPAALANYVQGPEVAPDEVGGAAEEVVQALGLRTDLFKKDIGNFLRARSRGGYFHDRNPDHESARRFATEGALIRHLIETNPAFFDFLKSGQIPGEIPADNAQCEDRDSVRV